MPSSRRGSTRRVRWATTTWRWPIDYCGICGSDLHTAFGGWGKVWTYPIIVGHEIVGTVRAKGKNVAHLNVGDRVGLRRGSAAPASTRARRRVAAAPSGRENHCDNGVGTYGSKVAGRSAVAGRLRGHEAASRPPTPSSSPAPSRRPKPAPLLCAGATVYTPLKRWGAGAWQEGRRHRHRRPGPPGRAVRGQDGR